MVLTISASESLYKKQLAIRYRREKTISRLYIIVSTHESWPIKTLIIHRHAAPWHDDNWNPKETRIGDHKKKTVIRRPDDIYGAQ
jgi:hypothetical protein